jgi:hypothetical protein
MSNLSGANFNNSLVRSMGKFESILNVPLRVAKKIYLNDTWFDNSSKLTNRFVIFNNDNGNLKVVVKKDVKPVDYHIVTKVRTYKEGDVKMINQDFINMCFSVNGNKGPYNAFEKYYAENGKTFPKEDDEISFLGHFAWVLANAWSFDDPPLDPVVTKVLAIAGMSIDELKKFIEDNKSTLRYELLLNSRYADAYYKFINGSLDNKNSEMTKLDLTNGKFYINSIQPSQNGGRKRLSRTKKVNRKSIKTSKSRKTLKSRKY